MRAKETNKVSKPGQIVLNTSEAGKIIFLMEMASWQVPMGSHFRDHGIKVLWRVLVNIMARMDATKVSGNTTVLMGKGFKLGMMAVNMKGSLAMAKSMVKEHIFGLICRLMTDNGVRVK
jgi:hypothetical protein